MHRCIQRVCVRECTNTHRQTHKQTDTHTHIQDAHARDREIFLSITTHENHTCYHASGVLWHAHFFFYIFFYCTRGYSLAACTLQITHTHSHMPTHTCVCVWACVSAKHTQREIHTHARMVICHPQGLSCTLMSTRGSAEHSRQGRREDNAGHRG